MRESALALEVHGDLAGHLGNDPVEFSNDLLQDLALEHVIPEALSEEVHHAPGQVCVDEDKINAVHFLASTVRERRCPHLRVQASNVIPMPATA